MQEEKKQQSTSRNVAEIKPKPKQEAKRHKMHANNTDFTADGLKRTFSNNVVNEFAFRGSVVSVERKKNIRLHLGIVYASMWIDYVKDAAIHAMRRSTGKTAIISVEDVKMAIGNGKGRKVVYGIIDEKKEKKRLAEIKIKKTESETRKRKAATAESAPRVQTREEEEEEEVEQKAPKRVRIVVEPPAIVEA